MPRSNASPVAVSIESSTPSACCVVTAPPNISASPFPRSIA